MFWFLAAHVFSEIKFDKLDYLLPYKDKSSQENPTLIVSTLGKTCVDWTNLNKELIRVTPIKTRHCSAAAQIEVIVTGNERKSAKVLVSENSGKSAQLLTFYIDHVASLSLKSSTKSIVVDSVPITFQLIGYDSNNNTFDTLSSLPSVFKPDNEYLSISARNASATSISLQGTKIGKTSLSCSLYELTTKIQIFVIDQIAIFPGPILHVPINHTLPLKLCAARGQGSESCPKNCTSVIDKSHFSKYTITSTNDEVIKLSSDLTVVTKEYGTATIMVVDNEAIDNVAYVQINVDKITRAESDPHYVLIGHDPTFDPVYYSNEHKLLTFSKLPAKIINGSWDKLGKQTISFQINGFTFSETVYVCEPYKIEPRIVLPLPYLHPIPINGGSGNNTYSVSEKSIMYVKNHAIKTTKEGRVNLTIQDANIPYNTITTEVVVSKIKSAVAEISDSEIMIGSKVKDFHCNFYPKDGEEYSVKIPYRKHTNAYLNKEFKGVAEGFGEMWCSDDIEGVVSNKKKVTVLKELKVSVDGRAAPNSPIPLIIKGGPLKWENARYPSLTVSCSGVQAKTISYSAFSVDNDFEGKCIAMISNIVTKDNFLPLSFEATFTLNVSKVASFSLHAIDELASTETICASPSINYSAIDELHTSTQEVFNAVLGHKVDIISVARDAKGQYIKYHNAVKELLQVNNTKVNAQFNEKTGILHYQFVVKQSIPVTATSTLGKAETFINAILPFTTTTENTFYASKVAPRTIMIKGGSGHFAADEKTGEFTNVSFTPSVYKAGKYEYTLRDVCSDQAPVKVAVEMIEAQKIEIESPDAVLTAAPFTYSVKAFAAEGVLIPEKFHQYVNLKTNKDARETDKSFSFEIKASAPPKMTLVAQNEKVKDAKTVKVLPQIEIEQHTITVLPGQTKVIKILSGSNEITLGGYNPNIISLSGRVITALKPGTTKILASSSQAFNMKPFEVTVIVPKPLNLNITKSTSGLVEGGKLGLELFVNTDYGLFRAPAARWTIPKNFDYEIECDSYAIVNLTASGNLIVRVESLGLKYTLNEVIETKLALPSSILLAPHTKYQFETPMTCKFTVIDQKPISTITGTGLLSTGNETGISIVKVTSKYQTALVLVNIEKPATIIVKAPPLSNKLYAIIVNEKSLPFTSLIGIKFNATSDNAKISKFQSNHAEVSRDPQAHEYVISVNAFNDAFQVSRTIAIGKPPITPEMPSLLVGSSIQMHSVNPYPSWSTSNKKIATISSKGVLLAKKQGSVIVSNGKGASTNVTIVKIEKLSIEPVSHTAVRVNPVLDVKSIGFNAVTLPEDLTLECSIKNGQATAVKNETGLFCLINPNKNSYTVKASLKSPSAYLKVSATRSLKSAKTFLVPDQYKVKLSQAQKMASIKIIANATNTTLAERPPTGLSVAFSQETGIANITISEQFSLITRGTLTFKNLEKDFLHIDVEWDNIASKVMIPNKKAHLMHVLFGISLAISLGSIYVILLQLGFI